MSLVNVNVNTPMSASDIKTVRSIMHGRVNIVNLTGFDMFVEVDGETMSLKSMSSGMSHNVPAIRWDSCNNTGGIQGVVKTCRPAGIMNLPPLIGGIGYVVSKEVALYAFLTNHESASCLFYVDRYKKDSAGRRVYDKIYSLG